MIFSKIWLKSRKIDIKMKQEYFFESPKHAYKVLKTKQKAKHTGELGIPVSITKPSWGSSIIYLKRHLPVLLLL